LCFELCVVGNLGCKEWKKHCGHKSRNILIVLPDIHVKTGSAALYQPLSLFLLYPTHLRHPNPATRHSRSSRVALGLDYLEHYI
jgi:hypothetical protein